MKNSKYFPFERNRYFYGKLLSVDDFELEQKYFNDKRRLINRFLFGPGIVSGLCVVEVDEQTISLETGFALDTWGREIIVDEPVLKKLSLIVARKRLIWFICVWNTTKRRRIRYTISPDRSRQTTRAETNPSRASARDIICI